MAETIIQIRSMKMSRKPPPSSNMHLRLDNVASYNIEVDIGDKKTCTSVTLYHVPSFLVNAFTRLHHDDAWNIEGIFRKEGNVNRIRHVMPVYFGITQIPDELSTHDICTLIKRFFREIKTPIFGSQQRQIIKFAESLKDKIISVDSIMTIIDSLPSSHIGTLGYLMRILKEISDKSASHQMTIANLATVFAPSLFRDDPPPIAASTKKRGSQDNLLSLMRTMNDLQTSVVKLLIQHSHYIGIPRNYYKATRKPSDLKRHELKILNSSVASKEFGVARNKVSPRSTSENPVSRIPSYSSTSSSALTDLQRSSQSEEKSKLNKRYSMKSSDKKDRRRSNSVVRLFSEVKNLVSGRRSSAAGLALADQTPRFLDTIPSTPNRGISMDPEPSPNNSPNQSSLLPIERSSRNDAPKCANPNAAKSPLRTPSKRGVFDVMRERTPTIRPPLPNWEEFMRDDDKKENVEVCTSPTKRKSDANQSVLSASSSINRPPTDISAISPLTVSKRDSPRAQQLSVSRRGERVRRHTAPVKRSLQRNQPNTLNSGLIEPKNRRSNTIVLNGSGDSAMRRPRIIKRPSKRRSNECLGNANTETDTDEEYIAQDMSLFGVSPESAGDVLERKGLVARQRRVRRQKTKSPKIPFESPMSVGSATIVTLADQSPLTEIAPTMTDEFKRTQLTPMSSYSPQLPEKKSRNDNEPTDASMPSDASSSDDYLSMKATINAPEMPPTLPNIPPPEITPQSIVHSPSNQSSKAEQGSEVNVHVSFPKRESTSPQRSPKKIIESVVGTSNKIEIRQSGTNVVLDNEIPSKSNEQSTPKHQVSPALVKFRKPAPRLNLDDEPMSPGFSKNLAQRILQAHSSKDLPGQDLQAYPAANFSNRPSLAFFQKNNRGFVRQRVSQFANLDKTLETIPSSNRTSANEISDQFEFVKPIAPPAAHALLPGELRRSNGDTFVAKRAIVFEHKACLTRPAHSFKVVRDTKRLRATKYCSPQRRVGERRNTNVNRQGLFQAMSRLSISLKEDTYVTGKRTLNEQTRTPSPKLPPRRNTIATSNMTKKNMQRTRSPTHLYKENKKLLVVPRSELKL